MSRFFHQHIIMSKIFIPRQKSVSFRLIISPVCTASPSPHDDYYNCSLATLHTPHCTGSIAGGGDMPANNYHHYCYLMSLVPHPNKWSRSHTKRDQWSYSQTIHRCEIKSCHLAWTCPVKDIMIMTASSLLWWSARAGLSSPASPLCWLCLVDTSSADIALRRRERENTGFWLVGS